MPVAVLLAAVLIAGAILYVNYDHGKRSAAERCAELALSIEKAELNPPSDLEWMVDVEEQKRLGC